MNFSILQLALGITLATVFAIAAYLAKSLNRSGAIAAFILGSVIFGIGGLNWSIILLSFFISSSLLSRLFKKRKRAAEENFSKGSRRDAGQVAANGAVAGLLTILYPFWNNPVWIWAAFAGALAAVNADTWATELGILNKTSPRLITSGKVVEPGTSGGISLTGTLAALGGAMFIALSAVFFKPAGFTFSAEQNMLLFLVISLAGLAGSLMDSLLGATIQAIYFCPACQKETEKHPQHSCGNQTKLLRGKPWLNNDWVNTFCGMTGALLAGVIGFTLISGQSNSSPMVGGADMLKMNISSPSFALGQAIPEKFTCSGANISPQLQWDGAPAATKSLAIVMDDPDAPIGTWTHWVIYNLPPGLTGLPEGYTSGDGSQGLNSGRKNGYMGPCPPAGKPHRYFFKIFATDLEPALPPDLSVDGLNARLNGHVLAGGEWMGSFSR